MGASEDMSKRLGDVIPRMDDLINQYTQLGFAYNGFNVEVVAKSRTTGEVASHAFVLGLMSLEANALWLRVIKFVHSKENGEKLNRFLDENA